jgi:hypothetical protein
MAIDDMMVSLDAINAIIKNTEEELQKVPFSCVVEFFIENETASLQWYQETKRLWVDCVSLCLAKPLLECKAHIRSECLPAIAHLKVKIINEIQLMNARLGNSLKHVREDI